MELKEEIATDGSGSLLTVSVPGGCASAQVEMGQMEGCVFAQSETKKDTHTYARARFLEEEAVGSHALMLCQRHPAHTL